MAPIHLQPTAPLAERVLLPGDPGRALLLAQGLLDAPKMFNHHRGLWGYTGIAHDGEPLTIQSTGMGGPSAAIVVTELADLGARTLLRAGTCRALDDELSLGDLILVTEALAADGTSRALGAGDRVRADPELADPATAGRLPHAVRRGPIASSDLFYDAPGGAGERWAAAGALGVDGESATLFVIAARRGLRAGCVLIVADVMRPRPGRIAPEALRDAEHHLGEVGLALLAAPGRVAVGQPAQRPSRPGRPMAGG